MPGVKINARDIIIQVSDGQVSPTWIVIDGLNSVTVNAGENQAVTDTTTFASQGSYEHEIMQRGASIEMEGFVLKDAVSGAQDPGQARCETLSTFVATASLGALRFRHPVDSQWKVWTATFSADEQGGENNDKSSWSMTATRSGASSAAAV